MAEIDGLDIKISADASKSLNALSQVNKALDTLDTKLNGIDTNKITQLNSEFKTLATTLQGITSGKGSKIYGLAKDMRSLTKIDGSGLKNLSSSLNQFAKELSQIADTTNATTQLNQLSNAFRTLGYKATDKAITNIPLLTKELMNMFNTLSKAPAISNNTIRMTNALSRLASQGQKVGSATKSMNNAMKKTNSIFDTARKKSFSLASAIGKFYATYFMVIRAVKGLGSAIKSSMDYLETLNYFNVAFEQVAQSGISNWEKAGYDSAEAYAKSFSERARQLTEKMSGFTPTDDGTLQATGSKSLGINPTQMMNYQAMFGQMSSSMGVTAETSLKLSDALTRIGADLASVKNMDFDKVWTDMASGLAGMSRTLDKYGVNIRNVNLQQRLFDLGINANITNLNQNEKALLRAIILLDTTRYAWSDLAETLNSPSNQLRLLTANFKMLGQMIGNLFLPIVAKVLPFINALVIALQRLVTWFGNLIGIDLSAITQNIGGSNEIMSDLADEADGLASGLGDATKQAKEFNKQTRGWDELNNLTSKQDTDNGGGAGVSGIGAGVLEGAFDKIYEEYTTAWNKAFDELDNKAQSVADKIEKYFAPLKSMISNIFNGNFEAAGQDWSNMIVGMYNGLSNAIKKVNWRGIGEAIGEFLRGINWTEIFIATADLVATAMNAMFNTAVGMISKAPFESMVLLFFPLVGIITKLYNIITPAIASIQTFATTMESSSLATTLTTWASKFGALSGIIGVVVTAFLLVAATSKKVQNQMASIWDTWINKLSGDLIPAVIDVGKNLFNKVIVPIAEFIASVLEPIIKVLYGAIEVLWLNVLNPLIDFIVTIVMEAFTQLAKIINNPVITIINGLINVLTFVWDRVLKPIVSWIGGTFLSVFTSVFNGIGSLINGLKTAFQGLIQFIGGVFSNDWRTTWEGVKNIFSGVWQALAGIAEGAINGVIDLINGFTSGINFVTGLIGWQPIGQIGHISIQPFANGGVVEDGLFTMSHDEIIGKFDNGRTVVANNQMITDGIYQATKDANYELVSKTDVMISLLSIIADKEFGISANDIFRSVRKSANDYTQTTGRPAFVG